MDLSKQLALSYYKTIATINKNHKVELVQHQETGRIYVKKILDVYNPAIYQMLVEHPVQGTPRIVEYHEIDGQLYLIEEYVSGISLQDLLEAGELLGRDILPYMMDLCQILSRLHSMHPVIIHRDIKPSNIIITSYNRAVLLDFNAAKLFSSNEKEDTVLLGTQGYAAPEQYGFGASSPLTDIYSLGVVFREMLLSCHNNSKQLHEIANKCMQMNPRDRYLSVNDLMQDLLKILNPPSNSAKRTMKKTYTWWLPPGFRTHTPWKACLATLGYIFVIAVCADLELKDTYGVALLVERGFCLIMLLLMIFASCNYGNVQRILPICQSRHRIVRHIGIIILDFIIMFAVATVMVILETTVFHVV